MDIFFDNEFRNLIPPLHPDERIKLESSLKTEGNRDPIIKWKETNLLLDGHNRYDICVRTGIPLKPALELSLPNRNAAMTWIINNQLARRNLQAYSRSVLALKLEEILAQDAEKRMLAGQFICPTCIERFDRKVWHCPVCGHHWTFDRTECSNCQKYKRDNPPSTLTEGESPERETRTKIAKMAHVSVGTLHKVKIIETKATPEQKAKLVNGDATVNQVFVAIRRDEVKEQVKQTDWPVGKYRVIYADPPWQYGNSMPVDMATQQEDHYPTMPVSEICKLPVSDLALDNAVLFLWATSPILEESFGVIRAWGFKYKAFFVWDKVKHNMGHYNSVRAEILLVAVRGSCQPDESKLFDSVQTIERSDHSAKPEKFREIIQTLYPYGPRVELFARQEREGWVTYGNQLSR
jgi:N6-adenosine-specific RNA methylase IME4